MAVTIDGSNTPTAGGVVYGDGTEYASTAAGTSGQLLQSNGASAPSWVAAPSTSPAGSTGQVQYNNAGAFGAISSGTSGQVLTSAGAGAAPAWASPAAGGSWIYLSTVTASNSATVDIETTIDSTYQNYVIVASSVRAATSGVTFYARQKQSGVYQTSGYTYHLSYPSNSSNSYSGLAANPGVQYTLATAVSNPADGPSGGVNFVMYLPNPSNTTINKGVFCTGVHDSALSGTSQITLSGVSSNEITAVTGIRFLMSSGNIASGTFRLYGIKNN